ncbi:hypothetical protein EON65_54405 [archaeon]|nr:MAG: hypothetical protein EON65_54405 [archaeon]
MWHYFSATKTLQELVTSKSKGPPKKFSSYVIHYRIMNFHVAEGQIVYKNTHELQHISSLSAYDRKSLFNKCIEALLPHLHVFSGAKMLDKGYNEFADGHIKRKFLDIIITDERLRFWRRLFLRYIKRRTIEEGKGQLAVIVHSKRKMYSVEDNISSDVQLGKGRIGNNKKNKVESKVSLVSGMSATSSMESLHEAAQSESSSMSIWSFMTRRRYICPSTWTDRTKS